MYFGHIDDKDSVKCLAPKKPKNKRIILWQEQAQSAAHVN